MGRIAYFISPHGFGHAARAAAIMEVIRALDRSVHFDIFTLVPAWFFEASLAGSFTYHSMLTDVGLVQPTPIRIDLKETIRLLDEMLPFDGAGIARGAETLRRLGCELVICDIAPVGIAVAGEASVPSVLVENFTWDWIYEPYVAATPEFGRHLEYLRSVFRRADYHIQTEPVCAPGDVDLTTGPVSRRVRTPRARIREQLGAPPDAPLVMISMGGIPARHRFLDQLGSHRECVFVVPGVGSSVEHRGNLICLPYHSNFFHPDLVNASDALVGKLGYSTVAEVAAAGIPYGYVTRSNFRESGILAAYVEGRMHGVALTEDEFEFDRPLDGAFT